VAEEIARREFLNFGRAGVERVLEILQGELRLVMGYCGARTVADITRDYVIVRT